jgi:hypothetical protein
LGEEKLEIEKVKKKKPAIGGALSKIGTVASHNLNKFKVAANTLMTFKRLSLSIESEDHKQKISDLEHSVNESKMGGRNSQASSENHNHMNAIE